MLFVSFCYSATQLEAEKEAKGEGTPEEYKFDSNCITPGTGFMARLGRHLRFFIRKKLSEDPVWQQPVVIFSGEQLWTGGCGFRLTAVVSC
jgi:5'-3' exoribonuclease 1